MPFSTSLGLFHGCFLGEDWIKKMLNCIAHFITKAFKHMLRKQNMTQFKVSHNQTLYTEPCECLGHVCPEDTGLAVC